MMINPNMWMETEVRKLTKFLPVTQMVSTNKCSDFKALVISNHTILYFLQITF